MTCLLVASATALGCGAADSSVDPGDLELRDLLGLSPEVAAGWDANERARARVIFALAAGRASEEPAEPVRLGLGTDEREAIIASMSAVDEQRRERGRDPVVAAWVLVERQQVEVLPVSGERVSAAMASASSGLDPSSLVLEGWGQATRAGWDELAERQPGVLVSLARQAGYRDEPAPLPVIPAPQEPFAVIFVDAGPRSFLAVNPVLLAAQEPSPGGEGIAFARPDAPGAPRGPRAPVAVGVPVAGGAAADTALAENRAAAAASGNPYSFYGSINECAAFQRQRCQACATDTSCATVTRDAESVAAECEALSADGERGYFLLCINLALAMATVADCADDTAQCPQVSNAGNQLAALAFNSVFLDDATCAGALDSCLSEIFGSPGGDYPAPGEPEPPDPLPPPRDTNLSCGDSNINCDFEPSCSSSCSVGSCDNALSCGGCEGASCDGCESCETCDSNGGGGGGSGGSSGCDDGGGSGGGGSSGCDSGGCAGGCEGGGCDSGGCEGGSCSGGSDSCSSSCSVTRRQGSGQSALALLWVLAPCVFLEYRRRRERRPAGQQEGAL